MDRRNFFGKGVLSCAAVCVSGSINRLGALALNETACEDKVEFSHQWIKRFVDLMDEKLDKEICETIFELNGKKCYQDYLRKNGRSPDSIQKRSPEEIVRLWNEYAEGDGPKAYTNGKEIIVDYIKNPRGLKVKDGYCLCPLVENGPVGLSGTYCQCSIGYVKEMFETWLKRDVRDELLESLKRGGKTCKFKISLI